MVNRLPQDCHATHTPSVALLADKIQLELHYISWDVPRAYIECIVLQRPKDVHERSLRLSLLSFLKLTVGDKD